MSSFVDNEGIRAEPAPACLLCGQERPVLYGNLRDRLFEAPGIWSLRHCPDCNLLWLDPRPVSGEAGKLYESYLTHRPPAIPSRWAEILRLGVLASHLGYPVSVSRFARALAFLPPVRDRAAGSVMWLPANPAGRLLDIGCGSGDLLARMRALGWTVTGFEPDPVAAQAARKRFRLDIHSGTLEEAGFTDGEFTAITLHHVLEHVHDPVATLRQCKRLLAGAGALVVVTPNLNSLGHRRFGQSWRGLELPRHFFVFSPQSLQMCADRAGLAVRELRTISRLSTFIYHCSDQIRRFGRLPGGIPRTPNWPGRVAASLFYLNEHLLLSRRAWGEEILLVAGAN